MRALTAAVVSLGLLAAACGGVDEETEPSVPKPPEGCAPGEAPLDGGCRPAGVLTCAEGFVLEDAGCHANLPADPCPRGTMAVPGQTSCAPVAPCPSGRWGDIPVDATTQYVDGAYTGGANDGSATNPWTSVQAGIAAAAPGAIVAVAAGSYGEDVSIFAKAVRLWGVCPDAVAIVGTGATTGALEITSADGTEIRDLSLGGAVSGMLLWGTQVLADRVWIRDAAERGINAQEWSGRPSNLTLTASLVESVGDLGVYGSGSAVAIERSVVRQVSPTNGPGAGRGVAVTASPAATRAGLVVRGSLVESSHEVGIFASGADVQIDATLVRDISVSPTTLPASGVSLAGDDPNQRSVGTISASVIERVEGFGMLLGSADVAIDATSVRDIASSPSGNMGRGIEADDNDDLHQQTNVTIQSSLVERTTQVGVLIGASVAVLDGLLVRDVVGDARALNGAGIVAQLNLQTLERANVAMRFSRVDGTRLAGILVTGSDATVQATRVTATATQLADDKYGDGVCVIAHLAAASALLQGVHVDASTRAGITSFGAAVEVHDAVLDCNAIDLDAETYDAVAPMFIDGGGNHCGCGEQAAECQVSAVSLEAPSPV